MMNLLKSTFMLVVMVAKNDSVSRAVAQNPSGSCVAEDNGGRKGYHSPGPNDTYLPDCANPLKRELWRVFEKEDGTAYMIPRPDGLGIKYNLCAEGDTSTGTPPMVDTTLSEKAEQYGLCDEIVSDPSLLNSMDPADALQFANVFHQQLRFVTNGAGDDIDPWVPDTDILAACEVLSSEDDNAAAKTYCEQVAGRCSDDGMCIDIGFTPSPEAVTQLLPALNEIYGIANAGDRCVPEGEPSFGCALADCTEPPEGCQYVFDHYVVNNMRDCCAELCHAVDSNGNECTLDSSSNRRGAELYSVTWFVLGVLLLPILSP
mmetsp:Transcript_92442/g.138459  ORF Transcript_92442/g.138459 Transcript_92442/m.138459 type:complete len:317 (-) Transcript_92442:81-1031(-)